MEGRPFNVYYSQKIFWGCKFKKKAVWIIVGELWNVVFVTKWKKDPSTYIIRKKREYFRSINFKGNF